jgi:hypothetical protein
MSVMLLLGVALIAVPLYLWRRPHKDDAKTEAAAASASAAAAASAAAQTAVPDASAAAALSVGEAKVISCRDAKKALDDCDRLPTLEQAFAKAIVDNASCLPDSAGGGSVQYVADINFTRKKVGLVAPKDGRTVRSGKALKGCVAAIKRALVAFPLEGAPHAHPRYKVSIVATYPTRDPH